MNKLHILPILVITLLALTPAVHTVQAKTNIPKWSDILEWLKEGDWFYYEVNVTYYNLATNLTEKIHRQYNFTIKSIRNNTIEIIRHLRQFSIETGSGEEDTAELLINLSDPKQVGLLFPFFIPINVTHGSTPCKISEGEWVDINQTIIIKHIELRLKERKLIIECSLNESIILSWFKEWIILGNYSIHIEISTLKLGLVTYFEMNITRNFIRNSNANSTGYSIKSVSNSTSHEIGILRDTTVELTEEETTEATKPFTNYLLIAIPILIAIPVGAILLKRRK